MFFCPTIKIVTNYDVNNEVNVLAQFDKLYCEKLVYSIPNNVETGTVLLECIRDFYSWSLDEYNIISYLPETHNVLYNLCEATYIYRIIDGAPKDWEIIVLHNDHTNASATSYTVYSEYSNKYNTFIINKNAAKTLHNVILPEYIFDLCNTYIYTLNSTNNHNDKCPYFSIILPVYNGLNYIDEAIKSIDNQEFKDYELIIVNDGSTDGTKEYLDQLQLTSNIYVIHQVNQKTAVAINNGMKRSRGKYITWTSHDNILKPEFLLEFYNVLNNDTIIPFIYAGCTFFGLHCWEANRGIMTFREIFFDYPGIASFMWHRSTIFNIGYYDVSLHGADDYDYVIRTIECYPFIYAIKKSLYYFRMHTEQATHSIEIANKWDELNKKVLLKFLDRTNKKFDITTFYPYINKCVDTIRATAISYHNLGTIITASNREMYRDTLKDFATYCFKKALELDSTIIDNSYILENEELYTVEQECMKQHELN